VKALSIILFSVILSFGSWSAFAGSWNKSEPLFVIERNKNKNYVQYDVRLTKNNDLPASNPVIAYWVLEKGGQENLTLIERKYAYGIDLQEKLEQNKLRVLMVVLNDREIIVEKINGSFRAVVFINGVRSILERVYIESEERSMRFPRVLYIDLFGWNRGEDFPMRERIIRK
jgi:hypothetical protein